MKKQICSISDFSEGIVHPGLKAYFGYCLYKSATRWKLKLENRLEKFGMIAPHLVLLRILDLDGPTSQVTLGKVLGIDKATIVKLIDCLEGKKLVQRTPGGKDRRVKLIRITDLGVKNLKEISKIGKQAEIEFLAPLTESEKTVLKAALPKLLS